MADLVLPTVRRAIELAEALAHTHDGPVFSLPATLATPADVIATLVYAVWRARQPAPRRPAPAVHLGCRIDKPPKAAKGEIDTHPIAVLGTVILCPGVTAQQVAATQPYIMRAIGGSVPGEATGRVEAKCDESVHFWLEKRKQQVEHGYTILVTEGGYHYRHAPPAP
jgi:hypothetical protein